MGCSRLFAAADILARGIGAVFGSTLLVVFFSEKSHEEMVYRLGVAAVS
jgi:hypothetical protein